MEEATSPLAIFEVTTISMQCNTNDDPVATTLKVLVCIQRTHKQGTVWYGYAQTIRGEWSSHTTYTGHTTAQKCSGVLDVRHFIPQLRACSTIVSRTTYLTCQSAIQLGASAVVSVQPQPTSAVIGYPSLGLLRT
ncbi:hypothetical protein BO83DRAFT_375554 [Aspergillus eucalypticola CBS 122712]|uniref:Uncharacterized protein n=1 Tax=Aspergillus eucalypticola (strain CBS 122712 / IBT 29274) TaxID=1448314 RepID=A0A317W6R3_ASPEC|nr:uncharacterized protein BO83DRAFT_375554 [Aspergillus eucalypticola CBS 122712]PWY81361.1 hypothetical protein BO83DRAFT_375554 [Aspergillus eucalypticola CBS 122712]